MLSGDRPTLSTARRGLAVVVVVLAFVCPHPHAEAQERLGRADDSSQTSSALHDSNPIQPVTQDPAVLWERAELHRIHGDSLQAARAYDELERVAPGFHRVWLGRADLALDSSDLSRALACTHAYLDREPADETGYATLARILDYSNLPLEAAQAMLRVIQLTQRPLPEHYEMCATFYQRANEPDEAIRILDLGADRLAPLPSLELRAVELLAHTGRHEAALRRLEALQHSGVRRDRILHVRGRVLAQSGRLLQAMIAWTDAIEYMNALPPEVRHRPITRQEKEELEALLRDTERQLHRTAQEEGADLEGSRP